MRRPTTRQPWAERSSRVLRASQICIFLIATIHVADLTFAAEDSQPVSQKLLDKLKGSSRDLNAPVRINPRTEGAQKQVLIYYANETAPNEREAENYKTIIEWLTTSRDGELRHLANRLRWDSQLFRRVVDHEIAVIRKTVADADSGLGIPVVVFTNRLARTGRFIVFREGRETEVELNVPEFDDYIYASNPLANPSVLKAALAAVADQFDPKSHDFVLITKSHGDLAGNYAMVPSFASMRKRPTRGNCSPD